jgi:hypothetical protein
MARAGMVAVATLALIFALRAAEEAASSLD